jgi:hypothetical protein
MNLTWQGSGMVVVINIIRSNLDATDSELHLSRRDYKIIFFSYMSRPDHL